MIGSVRKDIRSFYNHYLLAVASSIKVFYPEIYNQNCFGPNLCRNTQDWNDTLNTGLKLLFRQKFFLLKRE